MHELGLTQSILEIATEQAAGRKIIGLTLEIGSLSAVMPDAVRFAFDVMTKGSLLEGCKLDIIEIPAHAKCSDCGVHVTLTTVALRCSCGSQRLQMLSGDELNIKCMEIEEM